MAAAKRDRKMVYKEDRTICYEVAQDCKDFVRISAGISPCMIFYGNFTPAVSLAIDLTPMMLSEYTV